MPHPKKTLTLSLIKHYAATGNIEDALLPHYNQHGRWQEHSIDWRIDIPKKLKKLMEKSHLPADRRVSHGLNGDILHTSYTAHSNTAVRIDYSEIRGSLRVHTDVPVYAPHLQRVALHLNSYTSHGVDFPNLESVGGDVTLLHCDELNLPRLQMVEGNLLISGNLPPNLVTVGRCLALYGTEDYKSVKLKDVGESFIITDAEYVATPALESIGGDFLLEGPTRMIKAPQLRSIGGNFLAPKATVLDLYRLRKVGGDMDTRKANQYYHPDIELPGKWRIAHSAPKNHAKRKAALSLLRQIETPDLWI